MKDLRVWLNQGLSTQRDMIGLIQSDCPQVRVTASHSNMRIDIFSVAPEWFLEPDDVWLEGNSYAEWALHRCLEHGFSSLIAMRGRQDLIEARNRFAAHNIRVAGGAMDADTINLCERKDLFTARMREIGVPMPETIRVDTSEDLRKAIDTIGLDHGVCAKPVQGIYGQGYWRFRKSASLYSVFAGKEAHTIDPDVYVQAYANTPDPMPLIVMEHLPGVEHSIDCVCDDGRIVGHAKRRKTGPFQQISTGGPEFEIAGHIVAELKLDGLINVQTRENASGNPVVLEVNTRPSGGVVYSAAAGINLPGTMVRTLNDLPVAKVELRDPISVRITEVPVQLPHIPSDFQDRE